MGLNFHRISFRVFTSILIAAGVACIQVTPEPTDRPIVITPVAFQTQTPAEWATTQAAATAIPTLPSVGTPTPTPWSIPIATPWLTATATILPPSAYTPIPTLRPTRTPVSTTSKSWAQVQRDYRDRRITYDQAVEQAIDTGMSRPQARIAVAQIRHPGT